MKKAVALVFLVASTLASTGHAQVPPIAFDPFATPTERLADDLVRTNARKKAAVASGDKAYAEQQERYMQTLLVELEKERSKPEVTAEQARRMREFADAVAAAKK